MAEREVFLRDTKEVYDSTQLRALDEAQATAEEAARRDFGELWDTATEETWLTSLYASSEFNQDFSEQARAEWTPPEDLKTEILNEFQEENYINFIFQAQSDDELEWRVNRARQTVENEKMLAANGVRGITATMLAALSDPALLPLYFIPFAGAAGKGAQALSTGARVARYARAGAIAGAIEGGGVAAAEYTLRPNSDELDILYGTLLGGAIGGAGGAIAGRIQRRIDREQIARNGIELTPRGQQAFEGIEDTNAEGVLNQLDLDNELDAGEILETGSVNAAQVRGDRALRSDTDENIAMFENTPRVRGNIFDRIPVGQRTLRERLSSVVMTGKSDNPMVRWLGMQMGQVSGDTTGETITVAASVEKQMIDEIFQAKIGRARSLVDYGDYTRQQFNEQVARYLRGDPNARLLNDTQVQFANEVRGMYQQILKDAKRAGVEGFEDVLDNGNYLNRMYDNIKVDEFIKRFGPEGVDRMMRKWIKAAQPDIEEEYLEKLARGYRRVIQEGAMNSGSGTAVRRGSNDDLDFIRKVLLDEGIPDDLIDRFTLDINAAKSGRKPKNLHARRRLLISETTPVRVRKEGADPYATFESNPDAFEEFTLQDLMHNDIEFLFQTYTHRMSGSMALTRAGIGTEDSFETLLAKANDVGNKLGISRQQTIDELNALRYMHETILGNYNLNEGFSDGTRQTLRRIREFNYIRMMGQAGLAATIELANVTMENGLRRTFKMLPHFGKLWRTAADGKLDDALQREIEDFTGVGTDIVRGGYVTRLDDPSEQSIVTPTNTRLDLRLGQGRRFVSLAGGLAPVTAGLQRLNARLFASRMAETLLAGKKPYSAIKLKQLGLTDASLNLITNQIRRHAEFDGKRLVSLNLSRWDDEIATERFTKALRLDTTQNVQVTNVGSTNPLMRTEIGKTMFQFMSYTMGSNEQQFGRSYARLAAGDMTPVKVFLGALVTTGLTYLARVHANSIGREDREEYLKERLDPVNAVRAMLSYSGQLGIGTILLSGGLSAESIIQNPTAQLAGGITDAITAFENGELSASELRKILALAPAQNVAFINQGLNAISTQLGE